LICRRPKPERVLNTNGRDSKRHVITLNRFRASLVDKPVAQHHGSATQIQSYSVQHIACVRGHKRAERGSRRSNETIGSDWPPEHERQRRRSGAHSMPEAKGRSIARARFAGTRQRTRRFCALLLEGTRQRTRQSYAHLQKSVTEKDAAGGSLKTLASGSENLLGNSST
jgi:hypothetical protein